VQVNFVLIGLLAQIVANAAEAIRLSLVQVRHVAGSLTRLLNSAQHCSGQWQRQVAAGACTQ
jgi:hypothetical protein